MLQVLTHSVATLVWVLSRFSVYVFWEFPTTINYLLPNPSQDLRRTASLNLFILPNTCLVVRIYRPVYLSLSIKNTYLTSPLTPPPVSLSLSLSLSLSPTYTHTHLPHTHTRTHTLNKTYFFRSCT